MKRSLAIILTLIMAASMLAGCRNNSKDAETASVASLETSGAASSEAVSTETASTEAVSTEAASTEAAATETVTTEAATQAASSEEDQSFLIRLSTDGSGYVAYTDDGTVPKLDQKKPAQSCRIHAAKDIEVRAKAYPAEGYQFVKWTKNRKDYSKDKEIRFRVTEDAAYTAVFSKKNKKEDASIKSFKTLGDLFEAVASRGTAFRQNTYIYAFELDGVYYRALTKLPSDVAKKVWSLNYDDDDYDSKVEKLLSPLKINEIQNLSAGIPTEKELKAIVGKTGRQLAESGWSFYGFDLDKMEFNASHGPYEFLVTFDGKLKTVDDLGQYEEVYPLKVKAISYEGFGDMTDLGQ
ncbi:MAG: hypothetical protein II627_07855 [Lachnospiraceae bacterium]|nr:hypothetical protein [Lachnospiraceae bacterium]